MPPDSFSSFLSPAAANHSPGSRQRITQRATLNPPPVDERDRLRDKIRDRFTTSHHARMSLKNIPLFRGRSYDDPTATPTDNSPSKVFSRGGSLTRHASSYFMGKREKEKDGSPVSPETSMRKENVAHQSVKKEDFARRRSTMLRHVSPSPERIKSRAKSLFLRTQSKEDHSMDSDDDINSFSPSASHEPLGDEASMIRRIAKELGIQRELTMIEAGLGARSFVMAQEGFVQMPPVSIYLNMELPQPELFLRNRHAKECNLGIFDKFRTDVASLTFLKEDEIIRQCFDLNKLTNFVTLNVKGEIFPWVIRFDSPLEYDTFVKVQALLVTLRECHQLRSKAPTLESLSLDEPEDRSPVTSSSKQQLRLPKEVGIKRKLTARTAPPTPPSAARTSEGSSRPKVPSLDLGIVHAAKKSYD